MTEVKSPDPLFRSDHLNVAKIKFEVVAGARTRYWEGGTGEPLVLVHGGEFGDLYSLDYWSLNLNELSKAFRVFAFDRLGQGFTDNPLGRCDYTIDAVLEHVTGFLETMAPSPVHLVGHSRGGFLVMRIALQRPDLVKTVSIVDSNTAAPENPEMPSNRFYEALERRVPGPPTPDSARIEPELQSYSPVHITEDFLERLQEIALLPKLRQAYLGGEPAGRRQRWEEGLNLARQSTLRQIAQSGIPIPVLVVWGRDDPSAPLSLGIDLFDIICAKSARAEFHIINRAGHLAFREQPHVFNGLLRYFCLRD